MKTRSINPMSMVMMFIILFCSMATTGNGQCPVPPRPNPIQGQGVACPGQSKSYSINPVSGATSYTWTLPAGATISGSNPYTGTATTVTVNFGPGFTPPGTISVTANNSCGSSIARTLSVSAYYPGIPSNIFGNSTACPGDVVTYNITSYPDAISYTWTVPGTMSIQSGQGTETVEILMLAGFNGGDNISVAANYGCGTGTPRTKTIGKTNPPQAPTVITGPDIACPLETKSYSVDAFSGYSYTWTAPPGATISGQGTPNVNITFPSGYSSGKVLCKYTNNCGTSPNTSKNVVAQPTVPGLISGFASGICNGTTTYSVAPLAGSPTYNWTVPAGAVINSGQGTNSISVTFPATVSGQISVNATNACGTSANRNLTVTGNIIIAQQPPSTSACEDATSSISINVPGVGLSYQWRFNGNNLSDNSEFSGTQTSTLNFLKVDSLDAGNYSCVISSTCAPSVTSNNAAFTVNMKPPKPSPISGPVYGCPGNTGVQLSVLPGGYNTLSNYWEADNAVVITSGQNTNEILVDLLPTSNSGYSIRVRGQNACGLSKDTSRTWLRYQSSVPYITSGPSLVCQGQTNVTYTADPVGGASGYTWSVTPGITLTGGQGTLTATVDFSSGFTSGQVCINSSTPCFTSANRCKTVNFDVPATPGNISGPANNLCNTTQTFSVAPVSRANSYNWTLPAGATIVSGAGTRTVSISFSGPIAGNLCVSGVGNCTTGPSRCKYLRSQQTPSSITCSSPVLCANQTGVVFTCSTVPNTTSYIWTVPTGSTIVSGQGTNSITVNLGSNNGKVGVRAFNDCGQSGTRTYNVNLSCRLQNNTAAIHDEEVQIEVYPNPANEKFYISVPGSSDEIIAVTINDLLGKEVRSEFIPIKQGMNSLAFETTGMIKGLYLIRVKTSEAVYQSRIVID